MGNLVPTNPTERRTAEAVQSTASQVIGTAIGELRKADEVHRIGNLVIEVILQEMREHRDGTEARTLLDSALASLNQAEMLIRLRGETNGRA